ncbi:MAG: glycosyltransferase family 4 protein, partial [Candidatus Giovannonibacteria bacterium]|nr:glycosyltransferase family 4 protein [Candidatus Giovannonibacteria bacterium]
FTSRMRRDLPKREARCEGLVVRIGFGNRFDKFWFLIFGWFAAWRELKKRRGRIIFWVMDFSFGAAAAGFLKIFYSKIPLVFTIQYGYGDERVAKGRFGLMNLAFRMILAQADYVTAISSYLLRLCGQYGFIGEGAVLHNGVDLKKFTNQESRIGNHVIISTSRRVYKNGLDILEKAFEIVKKKFPDAELKIVSDVPYDELPKYLWKADVFARPSRSEGMGNSFVEALAAGLPIIGTPVGGILDIIEDGKTGLFAKVDDPKDLAEKIKILLEDKELAQKIVENGQKMVAERFSWDKIAAQYAGVFDSQLNTKKRILIATGIFPPEGGGPATYSKILLDELPKENFGVRVLSFISFRRYPKILRHILYFIKALRLGKNADIIFAQDPVSVGFPAMLAAKILRKKFILKIVGDYAWEQGVQRFGVKEVLDDFLKNKYKWEVEFLRKIQKFVANRANRIIVPSKYLKGVVTRWGIRSEKIHVVYNALQDDELFRFPRQARGGVLAKPAQQLIVSAGRLVPWKGFDALIEIMPEILKEFPGAKLVIIGDGPEKEKLQVLAEKITRSQIIFTGNLLNEKVLEYLAAADIFVLNTAYEGFSHLILEAMSLKTPVVTTDAGGNPELIEDGESGFLVKFNDKEALKTKILEILQNTALAQKLAENAGKKASKFSKERMINETVKILL